jgi:hypothetical protein
MDSPVDALQAIIDWSSTISGPSMSAADAALIVVRAIEVDRIHVAPNGKVAGARTRVGQLIADLEAS